MTPPLANLTWIAAYVLADHRRASISARVEHRDAVETATELVAHITAHMDDADEHRSDTPASWRSSSVGALVMRC